MIAAEIAQDSCATCQHWEQRGHFQRYGMGVCEEITDNPQTEVWSDASVLEFSTKPDFCCALFAAN